MRISNWLEARGPASIVLIRFLAGTIFLSEGIQKFLFAEALGAGRFAKIGIPYPEFTGPFVGVIEIVGGLLLLLGLGTRFVVVPLLMLMIVAATSTKITVLLGRGFWGFSPPPADKLGFWVMAHDGRTDFAMLLSLCFLLVAGSGAWSADAWLTGRHRRGGLG